MKLHKGVIVFFSWYLSFYPIFTRKPEPYKSVNKYKQAMIGRKRRNNTLQVVTNSFLL